MVVNCRFDELLLCRKSGFRKGVDWNEVCGKEHRGDHPQTKRPYTFEGAGEDDGYSIAITDRLRKEYVCLRLD